MYHQKVKQTNRKRHQYVKPSVQSSYLFILFLQVKKEPGATPKKEPVKKEPKKEVVKKEPKKGAKRPKPDVRINKLK